MSEPTPIQVQNAIDAFDAESRRWRIQGGRGLKWVAFRLTDLDELDVMPNATGAVHFEAEDMARRWVLHRCITAALTVAMHGRARRPRLDP